jgi:UDP-N-acetylglucosamine acyltransferase
MSSTPDSAPRVHPSAVVGPDVQLAAGVEIGPFCLLEGRIKIGPRTRLIGHVTVLGDTEIGADNVIHPTAVIGDEPQDLAYTGSLRKLRIGDRNVFREGSTVHRGCEAGEITIVGNDNFVMHNAHIAHDCRIGNNIIIAGGSLLAGWVQVGDRALISGNCVVHQFCRIGRLALTRGGCRMSRDIPPFCIVDGDHIVKAINAIGLRRAGMKTAAIAALRHAFMTLFGVRQNLKLAIERLEASGPLTPEVGEMLAFIRESKRGVAFGPRQSREPDSE